MVHAYVAATVAVAHEPVTVCSLAWVSLAVSFNFKNSLIPATSNNCGKFIKAQKNTNEISKFL
jgi:hypothetical protein